MLMTKKNLASAYESAGRVGETVPLFEQDHPDTLSARSGLAGTCESAGRLGQALPLHGQALADCERVLGHDPGTLIVRNNLASAQTESRRERSRKRRSRPMRA
jgi:hypothetical protein